MLLVSVVTSTKGQSMEYRIRANIPFDFNVANTKLPAGKYSVERTLQSSGDRILSVSDSDGNSRLISAVIPVEDWHTSAKARLVFHRYGDQYFLFQVWPPSATTGRQFMKSRSERELMKDVAKNRQNSERDKLVQIVTIGGSVE
jgi:hypothetical protein